ncbi:flavodoxin [Pediococcus siamensis]|uniref:flavodoxin n=1 Tax=Pediococcus siamensis TaxID=381829 RepID=UPI00399F1009
MNQGKALIIYFSLTGNTRRAAEKLQKKTGADLYQLQPATPYPSDYDGIVAAGEYEKDHHIHPRLGGKLPELASYDKIYVGYPTWWAQPPMIIHSLFEVLSFQDKVVVPFSTSVSTPLSETISVIEKLVQKSGGTLSQGKIKCR